MYFIIFISFFILQRLSELFISKQNEKWLLSQGAVEYGQDHYPFMIALHTLFIVSLIVEYIVRGGAPISWAYLGLFIALLLFKYWTLSTLGKYWNTKIYRVPNFQPIKKGPFRFLTHPNYMEVICEIAIIPLIFSLYYTAVIFSLLNLAMLIVRIKAEDKAWAE